MVSRTVTQPDRKKFPMDRKQSPIFLKKGVQEQQRAGLGVMVVAWEEIPMGGVVCWDGGCEVVAVDCVGWEVSIRTGMMFSIKIKLSNRLSMLNFHEKNGKGFLNL